MVVTSCMDLAMTTHSLRNWSGQSAPGDAQHSDDSPRTEGRTQDPSLRPRRSRRTECHSTSSVLQDSSRDVPRVVLSARIGVLDVELGVIASAKFPRIAALTLCDVAKSGHGSRFGAVIPDSLLKLIRRVDRLPLGDDDVDLFGVHLFQFLFDGRNVLRLAKERTRIGVRPPGLAHLLLDPVNDCL